MRTSEIETSIRHSCVRMAGLMTMQQNFHEALQTLHPCRWLMAQGACRPALFMSGSSVRGGGIEVTFAVEGGWVLCRRSAAYCSQSSRARCRPCRRSPARAKRLFVQGPCCSERPGSCLTTTSSLLQSPKAWGVPSSGLGQEQLPAWSTGHYTKKATAHLVCQVRQAGVGCGGLQQPGVRSRHPLGISGCAQNTHLPGGSHRSSSLHAPSSALHTIAQIAAVLTDI